MYELDFPAYELRPTPVTPEMTAAFGAEPSEAWLGRDLLCVFDSENTVRGMDPDMKSSPPSTAYCSTPRALDASSTASPAALLPKLSVPEDPVCGSGHCHIVPYWLKSLGREKLTAYQASRRGGTLWCRMENGRVYMSGKARSLLHSGALLSETAPKPNTPSAPAAGSTAGAFFLKWDNEIDKIFPAYPLCFVFVYSMII